MVLIIGTQEIKLRICNEYFFADVENEFQSYEMENENHHAQYYRHYTFLRTICLQEEAPGDV